MISDMDPPEWKQTLENEMVVELSKHLNPRLKEQWADFDFRLGTHLSRTCRAGLTDIYKAFDALKNKEVLQIGEYKVLRDMVNPIHVEMGKIIDNYTAKISENSETNTTDSLQGKVSNKMDVSKQMQDLENEMAVKLSKYIDPRLESIWDDFECMLSSYLDDVCIAGLKNIFMAIEELRNMEMISNGNYTVLHGMVTRIDVRMGRIIDEYTEKIRKQYEQEHT